MSLKYTVHVAWTTKKLQPTVVLQSVYTFWQEKHLLHQYSVNGKYTCSRRVVTAVSHMVIAGDHLVIGDIDGQLTIFQLFGSVLLLQSSACPLLTIVLCVFICFDQSFRFVFRGTCSGFYYIFYDATSRHLNKYGSDKCLCIQLAEWFHMTASQAKLVVAVVSLKKTVHRV